MKKYIFLFVLLSSFAACSRKTVKTSTKSEKPASVKFQDYEKATIIYFKRDGCDYSVQLESGENLEPDKLPPAFQKDSLRVWVKFQLRKDAQSICMMGKMIKILDIKKRNKDE